MHQTGNDAVTPVLASRFTCARSRNAYLLRSPVRDRDRRHRLPSDLATRTRYGEFLDALAALTTRSPPELDAPGRTTCHAELLQLTGDNVQARALAADVASRRGLRPDLRARVETVLGIVASEYGDVAAGTRHFRHALTLTEDRADFELRGWIAVTFLANALDTIDVSAADDMVADCESIVARGVHVHLDARLHLVLAELTGRRGLLADAAVHLRAVDALLVSHGNLWLEGMLAVIESSTALLRAQYDEAARAAGRALDLAARSGHGRTKVGALANLAVVRLQEGELAACEALCRKALALPYAAVHDAAALHETLAQVMLYQARYDDCQRHLARAATFAPRHPAFPPALERLSVLLTTARLARDRGSWHECLRICERGVRRAETSGDQLYGLSLRCLAADACRALGRRSAAARWIDDARSKASDAPLSRRAELHRAQAAVVADAVVPARADRELTRALRVLAAVGDAGSRRDGTLTFLHTVRPRNHALHARLTRTPWNVLDAVRASLPGRQAAPPGAGRGHDIGAADVAFLADLAGHPRLLAQELFILIRDSGQADAVAIVVTNGGEQTVDAHEGWSASRAARATRSPTTAIMVPCGIDADREITLVVRPRPHARSESTLHGLTTLVDRIVGYDRACRADQRARSAWPGRVATRARSGPPGRSATSESGPVLTSAAMAELLATIRKVAASNLPVLITGESGTGKEILARLIHRYSGRAPDAFVAFNCTSVPREMIDAQLFGHRRGAFTGAHEHAPGVVRSVDGGTLLLDEVGEVDLHTQPKLLRLLENGEIHPIGEARPAPVDVRVVAATNVDLEARVADRRFREDLYYRLNIVRLRVPPLRERREDIPPLIRHFLLLHAADQQKRGIRISDAALKRLLAGRWPGNVRQLSNEIRRLVALSSHEAVIAPEQLSDDLALPTGHPGDDPFEGVASRRAAVTIATDQTLDAAVEQVERAVIERALTAAGGKVSEAAELLGISRKGLFLKRRRLGIDPA